MSFGKMRDKIIIYSVDANRDSDGYASELDTVVATIRAYREDKSNTLKWTNSAVMEGIDAMFTFRKIPGVTVKPKMIISNRGDKFLVTSAELLRGYVKVMASALGDSVGGEVVV